jgi:hypothetical protein
MLRGMCVFACVLVGRAIATERDAAFLAGAQVNPIITHLYAFFTLAALRVFD